MHDQAGWCQVAYTAASASAATTEGDPGRQLGWAALWLQITAAAQTLVSHIMFRVRAEQAQVISAAHFAPQPQSQPAVRVRPGASCVHCPLAGLIIPQNCMRTGLEGRQPLCGPPPKHLWSRHAQLHLVAGDGRTAARLPCPSCLEQAWASTGAMRTGVQFLQQGGHAVDAAVATALCQGVYNPQASGIGGGGFIMVKAPNGSVEIIDAREPAPSASSQDMFQGAC